MTVSRGQMNLCLFMTPVGYHIGSWRRPDSRSEDYTRSTLAIDIAQQAERAKLDAVFIADGLMLMNDQQPIGHLLEPLMTLAALAPSTSRIGLIATVSTSFTEPYNLARYFASLDHLSAGRAGWNIVTSYAGGPNFDRDLPSHDERYVRADEYLQLVTALWDSWDDDAIVNDRESGVFMRPDRVHAVDFNGKYYRCAGPLNVPRPPQGWPVLVQAGSSDAGMDFAAKYAEVVFTAQPSLAAAQRFYADLKARVAKHDRDPSKVKVLPGLVAIVGATEAEARATADNLGDFIDFESGRKNLRMFMDNIELDDLDLDAPLPLERLSRPEDVQGAASRYEVYYKLAAEKRYTLRELIKVFTASSGHFSLVGTAVQVADAMQTWFTTGACDGFNLQMPYLKGLDGITELLVPELQSRGLFRTDYSGSTLREHLGLDRPSLRRRMRPPHESG